MTAIGALIGLSLSILLIIRKLSPTYSLIIGAIVGGLLGGLSLNETVTVMTEGVKEVTPAVLRILTAGVLSGILIQTGATTVISNAIINKMGEKRVFMALALATMLLCTVGVFIDVAVITVAPVALSIGKRLNLSPSVLLIAMIGEAAIYPYLYIPLSPVHNAATHCPTLSLANYLPLFGERIHRLHPLFQKMDY